jgi:quercetin dioxygenase-like cupin family protein
MREIRTFELEHGEPAAAWRVAQPLLLKVTAGQVWLTVEGDVMDYWLTRGETFKLPRGATAWLSAGKDGARVVLSGGRRFSGWPVTRTSARSWLPRWLMPV